MVDSPAVPVKEPLVNPEQYHLLSVQLSQHVQLTVQQFLMTFMHPKWHEDSKVYRRNLDALSNLSDVFGSNIVVQNLADGLKLISSWETMLGDPAFFANYMQFIESEGEMERMVFESKKKYINKIHPELFKLMARSKSLMHPQLLPTAFPSNFSSYGKPSYLPSEESLIAIGLEQFVPFVQETRKARTKSEAMASVAKQIIEYLVPIKDVPGLAAHIKKRRSAKKPNPIKKYFETGAAPRIEHRLLREYKMVAPIRQPIECLPKLWQDPVLKLRSGKAIQQKRPEQSLSRTNFVSYNELTLAKEMEILAKNRRIFTAEEKLLYKEIDYVPEPLPVSNEEFLIHTQLINNEKSEPKKKKTKS